ncbi:MAG: protein arginine N-methyltransferase 2 isoform, partial [Herminiimonas sp.]|nr:protein arginine N-methyltransferase 2 isoform [Herminiimonas sp.]
MKNINDFATGSTVASVRPAPLAPEPVGSSLAAQSPRMIDRPPRTAVGNSLVLIHLCDNILAAVARGSWLPEEDDALFSSRGTLFERFNRTEFDPNEPGYMEALSRFSSVISVFIATGTDRISEFATLSASFQIARQSVLKKIAACRTAPVMTAPHVVRPRRPPSLTASDEKCAPPLTAPPGAQAVPATTTREVHASPVATIGEVHASPVTTTRVERSSRAITPTQVHAVPASAPSEMQAAPAPAATARADAFPEMRRKQYEDSWFSALKGEGRVKYATLDAMVKACGDLPTTLDDDRKCALFYAVTTGKTGVVTWLTKRPGYSDYLYRAENSGLLNTILKTISIDNEDKVAEALEVLLIFLLKGAESGKKILHSAVSNVLPDLDAPGTKELFAKLKLIVRQSGPPRLPDQTERMFGSQTRRHRRAEKARKLNETRVLGRIADAVTLASLINASDRQGRTSIIHAAIEGNLEAMVGLINCGADIHHQDNGGMNPLMHAVREGHTHLFKALFAGGSKISVCSRSGKRALDFATEHSRPDMKDKFLEALQSIAVEASASDDDPEEQAQLRNFSTLMRRDEATKKMPAKRPEEPALLPASPGATVPANIPTNEEIRSRLEEYSRDLLKFSEARKRVTSGKDIKPGLAITDEFGRTPLMLAVTQGA